MTPERTADVITACAVLHNLSKQLNQREVDFVVEEEEEQPIEQNLGTGKAMRTRIINEYFSQVWKCISEYYVY